MTKKAKIAEPAMAIWADCRMRRPRGALAEGDNVNGILMAGIFVVTHLDLDEDLAFPSHFYALHDLVFELLTSFFTL